MCFLAKFLFSSLLVLVDDFKPTDWYLPQELILLILTTAGILVHTVWDVFQNCWLYGPTSLTDYQFDWRIVSVGGELDDIENQALLASNMLTETLFGGLTQSSPHQNVFLHV